MSCNLNLKFRQVKQSNPFDFELKDKLNFNKTIRQWPNRFQYIPFNISELQSIFLNDSSQFIELRSILKTYNEELKNKLDNNTPILYGPTIQTFYFNLLTLMREVLLTKDRQLQQSFLDKIYKWAKETQQSLEVQTAVVKKDRKPRGQIKSFQKNELDDTKLQSIDVSFDQQRQSTLNETMQYTTRPDTTKIQDEDETIDQSRNIKIQDLFQSKKTASTPDQPSYQIQEALKDYQIDARTKHQAVDPPNMRLRDFRRRQISLQSGHKPIDDLEIKTSISTTFPKQYSLNKGQNTSLNPRMQTSSEYLDADQQRNQEDQEGDIENLAKEIEKQKEKQKDSESISLAPRIKTFTGQQQIPRKPIQNFEIKSTYQHYQPTNNKISLRMENMWLENRNKKVQQKKVDEEMIDLLNIWSKNKGRIEKEIQRKIDTRIQGNEFVKCDFQKTNQAQTLEDIITLDVTKQQKQSNEDSDEDKDESDDEKTPTNANQKEDVNERPRSKTLQSNELKQNSILNSRKTKEINISENLPFLFYPQSKSNSVDLQHLETNVSKTRVRNMKTNYGKLLNISTPNDTETYIPQGLSVYDRKLFTQQNERLSNILRKMSPENQVEEQLNEIQEVKNRLAKYKINVPIQRLMTAMITPGWDRKQSDQLPIPGFGLLPNPFEVETKKKKKKGKK